MQTYAVYFRPRGSLGSALSSDTLFGAVCWGIQVLGVRDVGAWLGGSAQPPFAFGGPFPAWFNQSGQPIQRFYPRPETFRLTPATLQPLAAQSASKREQKDLAEKAKRFRQPEYMAEHAFIDVVKGEITAGQAFNDFVASGPSPRVIIEAGAFYAKADLEVRAAAGLASDQAVLRHEARQHNHVDRLAGATVEGALFYQEETHFAEHGGLWALVRVDEREMEALIRPALRYLADSGLGANRSVGKGQFDIWVEPAPTLPEAKTPNGLLMLSRYLPLSDEVPQLKDTPLAYRLTTLRAKREQRWFRPAPGQTTPPIYKRAIRMFEPGAVLPLLPQRDIYGRLTKVVDEGEGGPVYQSGAAIGLRVQV